MFVKPPVNMQCIVEPQNGRGGLYIGSIASANNIQQLDDYRIGAVVSVLSQNTLQLPHYISQFFVKASDKETEQLSDHFQSCGEYISRMIQSTNVLIHCYAGQSRSATLATAYLMKYHQLSLDDALRAVQNARRIAQPNSGFMKQLSTYERNLQQKVDKNFTSDQKINQYSLKNSHVSTAHQYKLNQFKYGPKTKHRMIKSFI